MLAEVYLKKQAVARPWLRVYASAYLRTKLRVHRSLSEKWENTLVCERMHIHLQRAPPLLEDTHRSTRAAHNKQAIRKPARDVNKQSHSRNSTREKLSSPNISPCAHSCTTPWIKPYNKQLKPPVWRVLTNGASLSHSLVPSRIALTLQRRETSWPTVCIHQFCRVPQHQPHPYHAPSFSKLIIRTHIPCSSLFYHFIAKQSKNSTIENVKSSIIS